MFTVHLVQAAEGDCLLLEYGSRERPSLTLVDGGPSGTYENHLRHVLENARLRDGTLDVAIVSHIDSDHIAGVVSLFDAWLAARGANQPLSMVANSLWHNATSDAAGGAIEGRLREVIGRASIGAGRLRTAEMIRASIAEGRSLMLKAANLGVLRNKEFPDEMICVDTASGAVKVSDSLTMRVVGPTWRQLDQLFEEWNEWLTENAAALAVGEPKRIEQAARADRSVPNLSSIVLLAEVNGRKLLLTGDARGDHIVEGLEQIGALSPRGTIKIDALKVPHHGSLQNTDRDFFDRITAEHYLVPGNGRHGNPPAATFETIIRSARDAARHVHIWVTSRTPAVDEFTAKFSSLTWPYELHFLPPGQNSVAVVLAS